MYVPQYVRIQVPGAGTTDPQAQSSDAFTLLRLGPPFRLDIYCGFAWREQSHQGCPSLATDHSQLRGTGISLFVGAFPRRCCEFGLALQIIPCTMTSELFPPPF